MANVLGGGFERWDTASTASRHSNAKVAKIVVDCPAASAGGVVELREGGVAGLIWYTRTVFPGESITFDYSAGGKWFDRLAATGAGMGANGTTVLVQYA